MMDILPAFHFDSAKFIDYSKTFAYNARLAGKEGNPCHENDFIIHFAGHVFDLSAGP